MNLANYGERMKSHAGRGKSWVGDVDALASVISTHLRHLQYSELMMSIVMKERIIPYKAFFKALFDLQHEGEHGSCGHESGTNSWLVPQKSEQPGGLRSPICCQVEGDGQTPSAIASQEEQMGSAAA